MTDDHSNFPQSPDTLRPPQSSQEAAKQEGEQSVGAKTAEIDADPTVSLKEGARATAGEKPNPDGSPAASSTEEAVPGTSDSEATDMPTANRPN